MTTPENFDRVQAAIGIEERPRTRRQPKKETTMHDSQTLTDARNELQTADDALCTLTVERADLEAQIQRATEALSAEQRAMAATHQAAVAKGIDFSGQLLMRQQVSEMSDRLAALEQSAFSQRAALDARFAEAQARVNAAEAAVAKELMRIAEATFLQHAAAAASAYREARRAAWTVRLKLGRLNTPTTINDAVFHRRFGSLPFFTAEGASSEAYAAWAMTREEVTATNGVEDQLRG